MLKTIEFIEDKIKDFRPEIGIVLGSGLGDLADEYNEISIPYSDIPGFPVSTVQGHKGQLVFATINGKKVMMMQGRFHYYEGHSMDVVTYPIKVMKKLGIKTVILTNAAGGVNVYFKPSDLMLIIDHINFMGTNPLIGPNDETLGTRFPDMSEVYTKALREKAKVSAKKLGIDLQEGVYMALTGPTYETPAEVKMVRLLGADAVGMSTVPEAIVANYCGMRVMGISCITNFAAGIKDVKLSHEEVMEAGAKVREDFARLIKEILRGL